MNKSYVLIAAIVAIAAAGLTFGTASPTTIPASTISPIPQATPEKPLSQAGVDSWIDELKRNLPDFVADEEDIDSIAARWKARKDLVGKTPSQLRGLLFQDVTSVIDDNSVRSRIWQNWEVRYKNIGEKRPTSGQTSDPCSGSKTEKGVVKFFNTTKGYGYITRSDGTEIFLHHTAILGTGPAQNLKEGDQVRFVIVNGPKSLNAKCVAKIK